MAEKIAVLLTTIDNPYDPHTEWEKWRQFDESKGYNTSSYLARIANTSDELSDLDYLIEVERAIDTICRLDPLGLYKKITIYDEK